MLLTGEDPCTAMPSYLQAAAAAQTDISWKDKRAALGDLLMVEGTMQELENSYSRFTTVPDQKALGQLVSAHDILRKLLRLYRRK